MKNHTHSRGIFSWIRALILVAAFVALLAFPPLASAQAAPAEAGLIVAAPDAAPAPTLSPWYADGALFGALLGAAATLVAIWQSAEKSTAQKINASLVEAIEVATKIPGVAEKEKAIKNSIRGTLTKLGVQPLVHRIVKDVT